MNDTVVHIEKFLNGEYSVRRLYKWYFAQYRRVALFQLQVQGFGDSKDNAKTSESAGVEAELLEELFDTLDEYRSERDLAIGLTGYTEAEVRRRLKKLVVKLRKFVPAKATKRRKNPERSSRA